MIDKEISTYSLAGLARFVFHGVSILSQKRHGILLPSRLLLLLRRGKYMMRNWLPYTAGNFLLKNYASGTSTWLFLIRRKA